MLEILSPAGDLIRLKTAVDFGADAVYFGGREFGMRAAPSNLTIDEIYDGCEYAHKNGVRAYLTLNTLPRNDEIARLPDFIKKTADAVDAYIVTDVGVIDLVKSIIKNPEIHISVQSGIINYETANFYHKLGAKRIVAARELSLSEISEIRKKTPPELEIEAFVHGAVCMSVSGRCLISNYLTDRDANRGECSQPCRWKYALCEETRPGEYMPIFEENGYSHILNANDMCLINHIPELHEAGITSLKIEGRAKTEYYVAATAKAYRHAVDGYLKQGKNYKPEQWIIEEMDKISHRIYTTGFYFGEPTQEYDFAGYIRDYELAAVVEDYKNGYAAVSQRNKFSPGEFDILPPKGKPFIIKTDKIFDENMNEIENAPHPKMTVKFLSPPLEKGSFIRIGTTLTNIF